MIRPICLAVVLAAIVAPVPGAAASRAPDPVPSRLLVTAREFSLLFAPTINSYKRFQPGSWAPTGIGWGVDNRTLGFRVVGHGNGLRVESRIPGADANPYLAFAATVAAGLHGISEGLALPAEFVGNAYTSTGPHVPRTLREARDLFDGSTLARSTFGDDVVDHYVHAADTEIEAFDAAITDWELRRGFERL